MSSLLLWREDFVARESRKALHGPVTRPVEIHEYFHIYLHSFTIVVWDEKDIECEISCRIKHFYEEPGWRNWQTQRTQKPYKAVENTQLTETKEGVQRLSPPFHTLHCN